jgi:predicted kinase
MEDANNRTSNVEHPFVLILIGIPGSGKSHFASRLETESNGQFVRVNQDTLGSLKRCITVARASLQQVVVDTPPGGKTMTTSVVIDRCNFNNQQRQIWIDLANEMQVDCECIIFDYDTDVCITRCQQRTNHETIHPSDAIKVVSKMAKLFRPPTRSGGERYKRISRVTSFHEANVLADRYLARVTSSTL